MSATAQINDAALNPMGLNGLKFVEFTSPELEAMAAQFDQLGCVASHRHPSEGCGIHLYAVTTSMVDGAFFSADGELWTSPVDIVAFPLGNKARAISGVTLAAINNG